MFVVFINIAKIILKLLLKLFHGRTRTAYLWHYVCSGITGW